MTAIPLRRIEGKYEILEKLGEGGMGTVYKVRHRLLDEVRVIKVMRQQLLQEEDLKARFFREARVAIQLRHPSIAQIYDFSLDDDDVAFIVMEFIEGINLENLLRHQGPPPLGLALEIAQQTLRALHYLHGKGFVHRDISPDNLMLAEGPDGELLIKLIDLGIAKTLEGTIGGYLTQAGAFLGKVRYAPPEQFSDAGAVAMDARSDLYSFGVVLYELLTGHFPIRGRDPSSLIAGHLFWPPLEFAESDPENRLPEPLRAAILRALAKKPEERFPSAQEMARALAVFRQPGDLEALDLRSLLHLPASGTAQLRIPPGSTQDRLDMQFGLRTTPSPSRVVEITRAFLVPPAAKAAPAPEPEKKTESLEEVRTLIRQVEERIVRGDYQQAELMLFEAEVDFGSRPEFTALHERLAEERRRAVAAKVEARQRAVQIAAAVAEIESRLAQGQVDRAGEILDETMSSFGEGTISGELRSRIRDLREQAQNAERAALLEAARERFETGDLEGALEAADQMERLAPGDPEACVLRDQITTERRRREEEEARRLAEEARRLEEEEAHRRAEEARHREEEARHRAEEARRQREEARREAAVASHLEAARGLVQDGELEAAEAKLDVVEDLAPGREDVQALRGEIATQRRHREEEEARRLAEDARRREEETRRRAEEARRQREEARREAAVASHLEAARRLVQDGELEAAEAELDATEDLAPGREDVQVLRGEITAERRHREEEEARRLAEDARRREEETKRQKEEARRQKEEAKRQKEKARREAAVASHLEAARRLVQDGELEAAEAELDATEAISSDRQDVRALREEIAAERRRREDAEAGRLAEEIRLRKEEAMRRAEEARRKNEEARREAAVASHLEAARRLFQDGELEAAEAELDAVDALSPALEEARTLGDEVRAEKERREEERQRRAEEGRRRKEEARRAAALVKAVSEVNALLKSADLDAAGERLTAALAKFGQEAALLALSSPLDEARQLREQELHRQEEEARRREEELRRDRELAAALDSIDRCLDAGQLEEAARLLPAAVASFGGAPALRERWERLHALWSPPAKPRPG